MAGFLPNSLIEISTQPQELDEFILQTSGSTSVDKINYTNLLKGALRPSDIGVSVQPYDANTLTSETNTTLSLSANILTYTDETGVSTNIDLSLYLDDTNLSYIQTGTLDGVTGIATFTRDDASTFTLDLSALLDTNVIVEDSLVSTSSTNALSANQGKILDDKISLNIPTSEIGVSVQPYDASYVTHNIAGAVSDLVVDGSETVAGNANKINDLLASLRTAGLLAV